MNKLNEIKIIMRKMNKLINEFISYGNDYGPSGEYRHHRPRGCERVHGCARGQLQQIIKSLRISNKLYFMRMCFRITYVIN